MDCGLGGMRAMDCGLGGMRLLVGLEGKVAMDWLGMDESAID